jgi:hypothetical protein
MRACLISILAGLLLPVLSPSLARALAQSEPVVVDAADLARRKDLVGKVVVVDDRVRFYQSHAGQGYDELYLKRTKVVFRLPPRLRPEGSPRPLPVEVQGRLGRDNDQLVCDVTSLKVLPNDLDRLDQAIGALSPRDFENRKAWAAWAEARGKAFKDNALIQRARSLEAEALRLEGEQERVTVDAPKEWLALAEEARRRHIAEPEPSALAHKALQARLAGASKSDALKEIIPAIERFFPEAARDQASGRNLGRWNQAYSNDPGAAYRAAPADLRKALDRRLWADAVAKLLEAQAALDPHSAIELASRAESELPDRPQLATKLLNTGLDQARQNLGSLRLAEVSAMVRAYREKLQNPQGALELCRNWLKIQRARLSETDAEGPVALAALYEDLLQDRAAARQLLERAWKIDPGSKDVAEAFRTRGYRRVKDQWVDTAPTTADAATNSPAGTESTRLQPSSPQGLRGKTPDEVRQLMASKPEGKVISGTKGQLIEQWIFLVPNQSQVRYVNFLHTPGELQPRVVSDYFLPRNVIKGPLKSVP